MKKTKIICSIGPSSVNVDVMENLVNAGMNVARINFSHATIEEREAVVASVKEVRKRTDKTVAILYDTKGPDFRTGVLKDEYIDLIDGNILKIVKNDIIGTTEKITVNYKDVFDDINAGNIILLEDGLMKLEVVDKTEEDGGCLVCKIINGGKLGSRKGINVPGIKLSTPFLSDQDRQDIIYSCHHEGDILALSFVETKEDILTVRKILAEENRNDMLIISKVESGIAIENIDDIIEHSDGIMIARGDLGVEVPMYEVPFLQKMIIKKCRQAGKFCIVATEMLASMYKNARPTRAEATDIANAVLDGTDAVMLSGETTIGNYPLEAVKYMAEICENAEKNFEFSKSFNKDEKLTITEAIAKNVIKSAFQLKASLIVVPTNSGYSARKISNLKPNCLILALCKNESVARKLALNYGVYAKIVPHYESLDAIILAAKENACNFMKLEKNNIVIITGGFNISDSAKATNFMKIEEI